MPFPTNTKSPRPSAALGPYARLFRDLFGTAASAAPAGAPAVAPLAATRVAPAAAPRIVMSGALVARKRSYGVLWQFSKSSTFGTGSIRGGGRTLVSS